MFFVIACNALVTLLAVSIVSYELIILEIINIIIIIIAVVVVVVAAAVVVVVASRDYCDTLWKQSTAFEKQPVRA